MIKVIQFMKLNFLVLFLLFSLSINAFAKKNTNFKDNQKSESFLAQEFELKKEFEVDIRNKKISIFIRAANCINGAIDKVAIENCIKEEKNDFKVLKSWEKEHKATYKIK